MRKLAFVAILFAWRAYGAGLTAIQVSGEKEANVVFQGAETLPQMVVDDGAVELTFAGLTLAESTGGKIDLPSPHTLIQRVSAINSGSGTKVRVVVNGSIDGLKSRLALKKDGGTVRLALAYPAGGAATIKLLQEEQAPIATEAALAKSSSGSGWVRLFLALFVFALAGAGAFFAAKFLKKQGAFRGSRKYLVENLAYCPVGPGGKTGVSLIKVGSEFVLVGVTGQQVSFLSNLPKLSAQYESENHFERDTFRAAVEEEVQRMKTKGEITV